MLEIFDNAIEMTPKIFRSTPTRWPMKHPDTGEIVKLPSDRGITVDFKERTHSGTLKAAPRPYWEPIQIGRDYADMLIRPEWGWDWYGHLTFKDEIHPEAADKIFMKWVHNINRRVFGSRYWNRKDRDGVLWARGLETQKRGVIHYHFLMSRVPGDVKRLVMMDEWNSMAGYARIYPFEAGKGAEYYICKYAAKGGEIDFGGPLSLVGNRLPSL